MRVCEDCGMPHRRGASGHCIAKEEARKKLGYIPDDRKRLQAEVNKLTERWGLLPAQSGGSR